jgi:phosphomannomutase/phosphoglucomutase
VDVPDDLKFQVVDRVRAAFDRHLHQRRPLGRLKQQLREVITIDGVRAVFDQGWGLIRASNTQPALVLRFEAPSEERLADIRAVIEGELSAARSSC